jgi:type II secretory pathway component PulL
MDNAFSLALMEIEGRNGLNFRKGPFAAKKFWEEHKKSLIKTGILVGLVLAVVFFNVALDSYFMGKKLAGLNNQITGVFTSTFPEVKKIVDPLHQMRIKIQDARKNALLTGQTEKNISTIDILNNISKLIPKNIDVNLTRLVIGVESIVISGNTDTFNSVDNIKNRLEKSDLFKKIIISSANIDKSDNRVRFKLKVNL